MYSIRKSAADNSHDKHVLYTVTGQYPPSISPRTIFPHQYPSGQCPPGQYPPGQYPPRSHIQLVLTKRHTFYSLSFYSRICLFQNTISYTPTWILQFMTVYYFLVWSRYKIYTKSINAACLSMRPYLSFSTQEV